MARKIKKEYEKEGLYINTEKTKYLCIDNTEINLKIRKNEVIKTCKYKYLGAEITKDGKDSEEIKQRIGLGRRAVRRLNGVWWQKEITRGRKKHICNIIVESNMLYGAEARRLSEVNKRKINAVKMDASRRSRRISREHVTNKRIREMMSVECTIMDNIEKK